MRAVGLGKSYRISHLEQLTTIRDSVQAFMAQPRERLRALVHRSEAETIWALKDVSFELRPGEVLGIVGRNGAGKSTLLKILSRITEPTEGYVDIRGRLASLLEVGTGFHPELTGRDNILLNGAILGMRRSEIVARYDEIVEFAGVEKFIDTPVKRYSSGMYMRLGFAVAAHLDPDILVVDEVLSVGDQEFQRKSLGKMREVTSEGRTILFVSHNLAAVRSLCDRAILLQRGRIVAAGEVDTIVDRYLADISSDEDVRAEEIPAFRLRRGTGDARFTRIRMVDPAGKPIARLHHGQPFTIGFDVETSIRVHDAIVQIGISTLDGIRVATCYSTDGGQAPWSLEPGAAVASLGLDVALLPGRYSIDLSLHHGVTGWLVDAVDRVYEFEALGATASGVDSLPRFGTTGFVRLDAEWCPPVTERESDAVESA